MAQITAKELSAISDLLSVEENLIAKYKERNEVQKHIESIRQRKSPKSDKAMKTLMHPKPNKPDRNKIETKKK